MRSERGRCRRSDLAGRDCPPARPAHATRALQDSLWPARRPHSTRSACMGTVTTGSGLACPLIVLQIPLMLRGSRPPLPARPCIHTAAMKAPASIAAHAVATTAAMPQRGSCKTLIKLANFECVSFLLDFARKNKTWANFFCGARSLQKSTIRHPPIPLLSHPVSTAAIPARPCTRPGSPRRWPCPRTRSPACTCCR